MSNRFKGYKFSSDKSFKRGDFEEVVCSDDKLCVVKWMDTKSIIIVSSFIGSQPLTTVERWDKSMKKYVDVTFPAVVKCYNENMGGVDLCDQSMEYYPTWFKTTKWTVKVILHFFDLAIVNSWNEYRRDCESLGTPKKDVMNLLDFRITIGEYLTGGTPKRADESDEEEEEPTAKKTLFFHANDR